MHVTHPEVAVPGARSARITSFDGTELAVDALGDAGPLLVLANGLGGSFPAWRPVLPALTAGRRIVSWDYRGLYRSGAPAARGAVTIEDHARDLAAVLAWAGGGPAVVVGWSMGVQVAVEFALASPAEVAGLVLVAGAPGDPLAGVLGWRGNRWLVPPVTRAVEAAALPFGLAARAVLPRRGVPAALRTLGVVAPSCDLSVFGDLAGAFSRLDWRVYMRTIRAMGRHDAWPRLGAVTAPTLVVGGDHDLFLPVRAVEELAAAIPGADLLVVPGATHYLPLEFPDLLADAISGFLAERVERRAART